MECAEPSLCPRECEVGFMLSSWILWGNNILQEVILGRDAMLGDAHFWPGSDMEQKLFLSNLQQEWATIVEGGVPEKGAATISTTKQEPTIRMSEEVQTFWLFVLSSVEIQKDLQGLCSTWPGTSIGRGGGEAGAWHSKQLCCSLWGLMGASSEFTCEPLRPWIPLWGLCSLYLSWKDAYLSCVYFSFVPKLPVSSTVKTLSGLFTMRNTEILSK